MIRLIKIIVRAVVLFYILEILLYTVAICINIDIIRKNVNIDCIVIGGINRFGIKLKCKLCFYYYLTFTKGFMCYSKGTKRNWKWTT